MHLNKEIFQQISHAQVEFEYCCLMKCCCDASCKKKIYLPAGVYLKKKFELSLTEITIYPTAAMLLASVEIP